MIIGSLNINKFLAGITLITASLFFIAAIAPEHIYARQKDDAEYGNDYNLILIAINNVGAEHMSLYGYDRKTTPDLDAWAKEAWVFDNAYTPVSWTLPAITTVFTSLHPYTHKIMDRCGQNVLAEGIKVLPQILKDNNYATAAFTGGLDNNRIFSHMRGFSVIDDNPSFTGFSVTLKQAKDWLAKNSRKKFFLFIHGYDAHPPFKPPRELQGVFNDTKNKKITVNPDFTYRGFKDVNGQYWANCLDPQDPLNQKQDQNINTKAPLVILTKDDIEYLKARYDETILSIDSLIGEFLNSLDRRLREKTIIIVFSEHGEMFAKHGRFGRVGTVRGTIYNEVAHVPLLIKLPRQAGKRISGLVSLIDIMPTILAMLDIPAPGKMQGRSLTPLIAKDQAVNEYIYAGALYNFIGGPNRPLFPYPSLNESIRDFDWKLIHEVIFPADAYGAFENNPGIKMVKETFELYDLKNDPDERNNIIGKYPDKTKELAERLRKWAMDCRSFNPFSPSTKKIPEDLIKDAQKRGYW
jgi:choline-sulfatase